MLHRVPEPTSADPQAEAISYRDMDHAAVNGQFVEDLLEGSPIGRRIVDLGCGPALIPILLCERVEQIQSDEVDRSEPLDETPRAGEDSQSESMDPIQLLAVDHCVEMLDLARFEIEMACRNDQIHLQQVDLTDPFGLQESIADTVICNTVLHHLDSPQLGIELAIRAIRPGGRLFVRDLVRPDDETSLEALVEEHAGEREPGLPEDCATSPEQLLRQSLHASLTLDEARKMVAGLGIDEAKVQMTSDRHWTLDCTIDKAN